jgi:hypothetical protein
MVYIFKPFILLEICIEIFTEKMTCNQKWLQNNVGGYSYQDSTILALNQYTDQ